MRDQPREKSERIGVGWKRAAPHLAGRVLLRDEVTGVIERHEDDDQAAQRIDR